MPFVLLSRAERWTGECWRKGLNYPRELFVSSTLDIALPGETCNVLPALQHYSYGLMNSQSSGLVLAEGKLLLKVVQKLFAFCAASYLSAYIWINMVCLEKIWFLGFWMKVLTTVWRAHLKWSSWMIQDMTLELSLAVWGELAVLWNYYGLVQLMSDEVVTWLQTVNGAHGVMLAGKKSQLKAWFFGTPEVKTEYFDYWWELCWTKRI